MSQLLADMLKWLPLQACLSCWLLSETSHPSQGSPQRMLDQSLHKGQLCPNLNNSGRSIAIEPLYVVSQAITEAESRFLPLPIAAAFPFSPEGLVLRPLLDKHLSVNLQLTVRSPENLSGNPSPPALCKSSRNIQFITLRRKLTFISLPLPTAHKGQHPSPGEKRASN